MKTIYIFILALFLPLSFYAETEIKIETTTDQEVGVNQEFIINIKLDKVDIEGFAKLDVLFPCDVQLKPIEYSSAMFIAKSNQVKFIWMELPKSEIIELSFSVKFLYYSDRKINFLTSFNYLKDNEKRFISINNSVLVIPELLTSSDKSLLIKEQIKLSNKEIKRRILFELNTKLDKDMIFRVQIAALNNNINENLLKELIESDFEIKEEYINGMHKYYIGNFYSLEVANMFKEYCGINGAFVIPYYKSERITISKSKDLTKTDALSDVY